MAQNEICPNVWFEDAVNDLSEPVPNQYAPGVAVVLIGSAQFLPDLSPQICSPPWIIP